MEPNRPSASTLLVLRLVRWGAILGLAALAGIWAWSVLAPRDPGASQASLGGATLPPGVVLGGPFELVDHDGRTVTERSYGDTWRLMFFGFTHCPDVCPTELQKFAEVLDRLGSRSARVTPLFVSVDPERDTPDELKRYVAQFDPRIVGLTGTQQQVSTVLRSFRVYASRVPVDGGSYTMDHSAFVYLMRPDGSFGALFSPDMPVDRIATALAGRLAEGG